MFISGHLASGACALWHENGFQARVIDEGTTVVLLAANGPAFKFKAADLREALEEAFYPTPPEA
jgi:hypothetical protein